MTIEQKEASLDLDALEALEKKATPGYWLVQKTDWESGFVTVTHCGEYRVGIETGIKGGNYRDTEFGATADDAAMIAALRNAFPEILRRLREAEKNYSDLILCVRHKHPNETCHETAKRYILRAEYSPNAGTQKSAATKERA